MAGRTPHHPGDAWSSTPAGIHCSAPWAFTGASSGAGGVGGIARPCVRVSGGNADSTFDPPQLPPIPTSPPNPLVFLGALTLRAPSTMHPRSKKFKRLRDSNVGCRAAVQKCKKYCQGKCSWPSSSPRLCLKAPGSSRGTGTVFGKHGQSLGFLLAPSLPEPELIFVSDFAS